jgi:alanine dehydrogenase
VKEGERRVALLPREVKALAEAGHDVFVQLGAGIGVGADDDEYFACGAFNATASQVWGCDLIVKVKEMLDEDFRHLTPDRAILAFHHLPGEPDRARKLAAQRVTAIAYEMVRDAGGFPLLAPMSAIAGRMAVEAVAAHLPREGGRALVLGAGHAGLNAASAARAHHMSVTVLTRGEASRDAARDAGFAADLATPAAVEREALQADLVVGAVFVQGEPTPKLIPRTLVARMKRGAVIADISIDAGGVAETSRATTHAEPTFDAEGVLHYCVANIPAADPDASAAALSQALSPFVMNLASLGLGPALAAHAALREGVLLWKGRVNHPGIAKEASLPYTPLSPEDLA